MSDEVLLTLLGAAIGWALNQYWRTTSENARLIDLHIDDLLEFSNSVQSYWLSEPDKDESELVMAARVRARQASLTVFYGEAERRLSMRELRDYQVLQLRLFETATGGNFETNERKVEPETAIDAFVLVSELTHVLRLAKKRQLSLWAITDGLKLVRSRFKQQS